MQGNFIIAILLYTLLSSCKSSPPKSDLKASIQPYNEAGIFIGYGWDSFENSARYTNCIDPGPYVIHRKGGGNWNGSSFRNLSAESLDRQLDIKAKIDFKNLSAKVNLDAGFNSKHVADKYSTTITYISTYKAGSFAVSTPRTVKIDGVDTKIGLSPSPYFTDLVRSIEQNKLPKGPSTLDIRKDCGDEFIYSMEYGSQIVATLKLNFANTNDKNQFYINLGAEFGASLGDVSAPGNKFSTSLNFDFLDQKLLQTMEATLGATFVGPRTAGVREAYASLLAQQNCPLVDPKNKKPNIVNCIQAFYDAIYKLELQTAKAIEEDGSLKQGVYAEQYVDPSSIPEYLALRYISRPYIQFAAHKGLEAFNTNRYFSRQNITPSMDIYALHKEDILELIREYERLSQVESAAKSKLRYVEARHIILEGVDKYKSQINKVLVGINSNKDKIQKQINSCLNGVKAQSEDKPVETCSSNFIFGEDYNKVGMHSILPVTDVRNLGLYAAVYHNLDTPKDYSEVIKKGYQVQTANTSRVDISELPLPTSSNTNYSVVLKGYIVSNKTAIKNVRLTVQGGRHLFFIHEKLAGIGPSGIGGLYNDQQIIEFTKNVVVPIEIVYFYDSQPRKNPALLKLEWSDQDTPTEYTEVDVFKPFIPTDRHLSVPKGKYDAYGGQRVFGGGYGLHAQLYRGNNLDKPAKSFISTTIGNNWGKRSIGAGSDNWSIRYKGVIVPPATGRYRFYVAVDDGVRMKIGDGGWDINDWREAGVRERSFTHTFSDLSPQPIQVHFKEHGGNAYLRVWWEKETSASEGFHLHRQLVPKKALFPL